jgi:predicted dithiol-disulfide oxidoreductase (DUF899 family)
MPPHRVVTRDEWLAARREHLAKEKEFTRLRDELSAARRDLPWVKVDQDYIFDGPNGKERLSDLFEGRHQLIVYHFMYGPDWEEGCPSCSFWADSYDRFIVHLNHRDISMVAISNSSTENLDAYRRRMGWSFKWLSSLENDFNRDYHVSFTPEEMDKGEMVYNYRKTSFPSSEGPGLSVFYREDDGSVYHTYSCYSRGLDMLNAAYHHMDLVPKGRDEGGLPHSMAWLRRHDQY